jgi:ubiquinone/menaquinone biosynthesis C-methylase UbiE
LKSLARKDNIQYLDLGCSEAQITSTVAEFLRLKKDQAFGVDLASSSKTPKESDPVTYVPYDGVRLPFEPATFQLATLFMSAHHFEQPDATLQSLYQVLAPGAQVIVREHDVAEDALRIFLDWTHAMYMTVLGNEMPISDFAAMYRRGGFAHYRRLEEWAKVLEAQGFQLHSIRRTHDLFESGYLLLNKPL